MGLGSKTTFLQTFGKHPSGPLSSDEAHLVRFRRSGRRARKPVLAVLLPFRDAPCAHSSLARRTRRDVPLVARVDRQFSDRVGRRQRRRHGGLPRPRPQRGERFVGHQRVTNGRGGTKACETTGTSTSDGYPEHAFTWDVVMRVQQQLNQLGACTQLSRENDTSLGPCIDRRAAAANAMRPDAIVSIHADGGPPSGQGFHVNYSSPHLNDAQALPAVQPATVMRDSLVTAGLTKSTYTGSDGLYGRADLAGLNLAQYPAILVELGNMKNPDEAAQMESPDGRARYSAAVTQGIVPYLSTQAPAS